MCIPSRADGVENNAVDPKHGSSGSKSKHSRNTRVGGSGLHQISSYKIPQSTRQKLTHRSLLLTILLRQVKFRILFDYIDCFVFCKQNIIIWPHTLILDVKIINMNLIVVKSMHVYLLSLCILH